MHASSKKRDKRLSRTLKKKTTKFTLRTSFALWFSQFAAIDTKRTNKKVSAHLKRKLYTRKFLAVWRK